SSDLVVGRGAFGGWDDADPSFARACWCFVRHLRPLRVLETGVARGLTTRSILEALRREGVGRLWSIDLPPLLEHDLQRETGAAVPEHLRENWTLLEGSSRRHLSELLSRLGTIQLFVHDSMHTERNLRFELDQAWKSLQPGGILLADDIERNNGFHSFLQTFSPAYSLVCPADDGRALFGIIQK